MTPDWELIRARLNANRCPCCAAPLSAAPKSGGSHRNTARTQGHIWPRGHPLRAQAAWVYVCYQCNHNQGHLALDEWLLVLDGKKDPRGKNVRALLRMIYDPLHQLDPTIVAHRPPIRYDAPRPKPPMIET